MLERLCALLHSQSSTPYLGGYSAEVPPLPIPNRVVKLSIADGTACCGRVGSRHFRELEDFSSGFLAFVCSSHDAVQFCALYILLLCRLQHCSPRTPMHFYWRLPDTIHANNHNFALCSFNHNFALCSFHTSKITCSLCAECCSPPRRPTAQCCGNRFAQDSIQKTSAK